MPRMVRTLQEVRACLCIRGTLSRSLAHIKRFQLIMLRLSRKHIGAFFLDILSIKLNHHESWDHDQS